MSWKATHGCGMNIIVKSKNDFDIENGRKKFEQWLGINYAYLNGFEMQYEKIKPRIIAEAYIENNGCDLFDYKFYCFNGRIEFIAFIKERGTGYKRAFSMLIGIG